MVYRVAVHRGVAVVDTARGDGVVVCDVGVSMADVGKVVVNKVVDKEVDKEVDNNCYSGHRSNCFVDRIYHHRNYYYYYCDA